MNELARYAGAFFDELEIYEDVYNGHCYKLFLRQAVLRFLKNETEENALEVYRSFFDSYRVVLGEKADACADILDMLRGYEEASAPLAGCGRVPCIHSVNVFVLGLCVYNRNDRCRTAFSKYALEKADFACAYATRHEEFFYRWGLASLLHDVGCPPESLTGQLNRFLSLASDAEGDESKLRPQLAFENLGALNAIAEVQRKREFTRCYYERYDSCVYIDLLKPVDLLSHKLSLTLGMELKAVKNALDGFLHAMARFGFVDHGLFSAILVLKWYGYLIQASGCRPECFFGPVLDSASAILLHSYYKGVLQKPPFSLPPLSPARHPIAYLLLLCDELQEWNRDARGLSDSGRARASACSLEITNGRLSITFLARRPALPSVLSAEKEALFYGLLDIAALFPAGLTVGCEPLEADGPLPFRAKGRGGLRARPQLETLEKLAYAIHADVNKKQLERFPDRPLAYPYFADLPDALKYANLRQACAIAGKLALVSCRMLPLSGTTQPVMAFTHEELEFLAAREHDDWVDERAEAGWVYGEKRDSELKTSPYMAPYASLPEDIKEHDRDAVRNIPSLLAMIGMGAYRESALR